MFSCLQEQRGFPVVIYLSISPNTSPPTLSSTPLLLKHRASYK